MNAVEKDNATENDEDQNNRLTMRLPAGSLIQRRVIITWAERPRQDDSDTVPALDKAITPQGPKREEAVQIGTEAFGCEAHSVRRRDEPK